MDIERLKTLVASEVESHRRDLYELGCKIHANPEVGFHEKKAAGWLTAFLADKGFKVKQGIYGLETAFSAVYGNGSPVIAFLAEYDALPGIGHACGHNLIGTASAGGAIGACKAIDEYGGRIIVIGTPAEELYGGKVTMAQRGAFADLDAAMMVHPGGHDSVVTEALACQGLNVEFFGKASHAAGRPEAGINALEAMILSFNAIDALRQHIKAKSRIHGIITDGGQAANVVPAHSAGNFLVRATDETYLAELKEKVLDCFRGAAQATGARLEYKWEELSFAPMLNNLTLGRLFMSNMNRLGHKTRMVDANKSFGSTDFGNVSQLVPGIHASISITAKRGIVTHSPQFAEAAVSEKGLKAMVDASKALGMTAADLLANPEILKKVKAEFFRHKR